MEMNYINSKGKKYTGYLVENEEVLPYILVIPEDLEEGKD